MIDEEFNKKNNEFAEMFEVSRSGMEALYEDIKTEYFLPNEDGNLSRKELEDISDHFLGEDIDSYEYHQFILFGILFRAALELYGTEDAKDTCNSIVERIQESRKRIIPG